MDRLHFTFYDPVPTIAPPNDDLELQPRLAALSRKTWFLTYTGRISPRRGSIIFTTCGTNMDAAVGTFGAASEWKMPARLKTISSRGWGQLSGRRSGPAFFPAIPTARLTTRRWMPRLTMATRNCGRSLFAVMQSVVAKGENLEKAIQLAMSCIPEESETAQAIGFVLKCHGASRMEWDCWEKLLARHGDEILPMRLSMSPLPSGPCYMAAATSRKASSWPSTVDTTRIAQRPPRAPPLASCLAQSRFPHDGSNPSAKASSLALVSGEFPRRKRCGNSLERTAALIGKLEPRQWDHSLWNSSAVSVDLSRLPGTLLLIPSDGSSPVPWANGELPEKVKKTPGGAELDLATCGRRAKRHHLPRTRRREIVYRRCSCNRLPGRTALRACHSSKRRGIARSSQSGDRNPQIASRTKQFQPQTGSIRYPRVSEFAYMSVDGSGTTQSGDFAFNLALARWQH